MTGLPEGYVSLSDIEMDYYPYIDTGVVPDLETEIDISFEYPTNVAVPDEMQYLLGVRRGERNYEFALYWYVVSAERSYFRLGFGDRYINFPPTEIYGHHNIRFGLNRAVIDGVEYKNFGEGAFSAGRTLTIGGVKSAGTVMQSYFGILSSCRIYQGGVLIRDFEPCLNKLEIAGLWDKVDGKFYGNAGDGAIRKGIEVKKPFPLNFIRYRTEEDVLERNVIGTYNASDLNRVAEGARIIHDMLYSLGYNRTPRVPDRVWTVNEIPRESELRAHHEAVIGQDVLNYAKIKHLLPVSLSRLDHEGANRIERFIHDTYFAAKNIPEGYIFSGEIYGGEDF